MACWKGDLEFNYRYDYTAEGARRSVEDSLQRLGLSSIDIVFIHDLSPDNGDMKDKWSDFFDIAAKGANPTIPAGFKEKRGRMMEIAKNHGTDFRAAAHQYTAAPSVVAVTIPGARAAVQARENAAFMNAVIPSGFWTELKKEKLFVENAAVSG